MQYEPNRLTYDETATMLAAMIEHPEHLTRERIGAMEYVRGVHDDGHGLARVSMCIDYTTGESLRFW